MGLVETGFVRSAAAAGVVVWSLATATAARADEPAVDANIETKKACVAQHEQAQLLRRQGRLIDTRAALVACAQEACPGVVRTDCVQWLGDVARAVPSVVLTARTAAGDEPGVRVYGDGVLLAPHLDGHAIELDPGLHTFRFESPSGESVEQKVLLVEGEKNRIVEAMFGAAMPAPRPIVSDVPPPARPTYRPIPWLDFALLGATVAGAAAFAGFGIWGLNEKKTLETNCEPVCAKSDIDSIRTKFAVADVGLAVGVLSAAAAGYVYFTRPAVERAAWSAEPRSDRGPRMRLGWAAGAAGASVRLEAGF
jgi:hypothetical protein